jgi:hypothetical protein
MFEARWKSAPFENFETTDLRPGRVRSFRIGTIYRTKKIEVELA